MKKMTKLLLVTLVAFSQLAYPIEVYAEVVEEIIEDSSNRYTFDVMPQVTDEKVIVNMKNTDTDLIIDDNKYIIKTSLIFNQLLDGNVIDTKNDVKTLLVSGLELKDYNLELNNIGYGYNGKYSLDISVYDVNDDFVEGTDLNTYIKGKDTNYNKQFADFYNNEVPTKLVVKLDSASITCEDKTCTMPVDASDKVVNINHSIEVGSVSEEQLNGAYLIYNINGINLYDYNFDKSLDFSLLLEGTYNISLSLMDKDGKEILTDNINVVYGDANNNTGLDTYFNIEETMSQKELLSRLISATVVDDNTLNSIGFDKELLQDLFDKKPIDEIITNSLTDSIGYDIKANSFTIIEEGSNYIGTITSDKFIGKLKDSDVLLTVGEVLNSLETTGLNVKVIDKNGNLVDSSRYIETGMQLVVSAYNCELSYTFMVKADIDGGLVNSSEVNKLIDTVLGIDNLDALSLSVSDINDDGIINLLDISNLAGSIAIGNWIIPEASTDNITSSVARENNKVIRVGDTFRATLNLKGFNKDYINALEGVLNYDKTALELVGIATGDSISEYGNFNYDTKEFIQAGLDIVNTDSTVMTFTFKALKETSTNIAVNNLMAAKDGSLVNIDSNNTLNVKVDRQLSNNNDIVDLNPSTGNLDKPFNKNVYEYNLYVDYKTTSITLEGLLGDKYAKTMGFREYKLTGDVTVIMIDVISETGEVKTYKINVIKQYPKSISTKMGLSSNLSSNNYLDKLEIKGYEIEFNKETYEYEITVGSDVNSLDITAIAESVGANVRIYGNDNFKEGENIVKIIVTAEDGSEKTYTIKVNKKSDKASTINDEDDENTSNNVEKTIIIILIILVVLGLLYLIFKKDDEEEETPNINKNQNKKK